MTRRPVFYGLCLLIGVLLSGIGGLMHPLLTGDGAAQLGTIARTAHWRAIHWSLLFGLAFMYTGLVGVALRHGETAGSAPARAGILLAGLRAFTTADTGLAGTHAVFVYDMLHPTGLAAERLATFMLGLVAYTFGWAIRNGLVWPRWLAWIAWVVAALNGAVAIVFDEYSPNFLYYGQAVFVMWLAATAVVMLAERRQA